MVLPATDTHGVVAVNSGVRNARILLNRCKVLDSEHEGDKGAARFPGKSLKAKMEGVEWRVKCLKQKG